MCSSNSFFGENNWWWIITKMPVERDMTRSAGIRFLVIVPFSYHQARALSFRATSACLLGYRCE